MRAARTLLCLAAAAGAVAASALPASAARPTRQSECPPLTKTAAVADIPWAQKRLDFQRVWPITTGAGQIVAVVDTGVDAGHPQLRGAVDSGSDVSGEAPKARADFDCVGHGTLVAGIIAARPAPGVGFAGVAPGARIWPVRQTWGQEGFVQALADGIVAAVRAHASVINVSVVVPTPSPALTEAVRIAQENNVLIVAAAGNDHDQGNPKEYPAALPGVLAVGAVDESDHKTSFSGTATPIGVVAPGKDLLGLGAGGEGLVGSNNGTSYAAPYVAGVAALVRASHPLLTAQQVLHRIEATADHPPGSLPDPDVGWGVVDPYSAVTAILPEENGPAVTPEPTPVVLRSAAPAARTTDQTPEMVLAAVAAAIAVLTVVAARILPKGQSRRWRPGTWR